MKLLYANYIRGSYGDRVHTESFIEAARPLVDELVVHTPLMAPAGSPTIEPLPQREKSWLRRLASWYLFEPAMLYRGYYAQRETEIALLKQVKPDAIIMRFSPFYSLPFIARHFKIPLLLEFNAPIEEFIDYDKYHRHYPALLNRMERDVLETSAGVMCVTETLKQHVLGKGIRQPNMIANQNGVDTGRFHPGIDGSTIREQHQLEDRFVIGFSGFFKPWHKLELLVDAIAKAKDRRLSLLLIGDGDTRDTLRAQAERLGIGDRVVITGRVPHSDMPMHIAACDACIIPFHQPFCSPIKLFEYMALAKPVISVDAGGVREIAEPGRHLLLTPPGDIDALATAIGQLAADPDLCLKLGEAGLDLVRSEYTWEQNARRALGLVEKLRQSM